MYIRPVPFALLFALMLATPHALAYSTANDWGIVHGRYVHLADPAFSFAYPATYRFTTSESPDNNQSTDVRCAGNFCVRITWKPADPGYTATGAQWSYDRFASATNRILKLNGKHVWIYTDDGEKWDHPGSYTVTAQVAQGPWLYTVDVFDSRKNQKRADPALTRITLMLLRSMQFPR